MVLVDIWNTTESRENIWWISFLKKAKYYFLYLIWWHYFFLRPYLKLFCYFIIYIHFLLLEFKKVKWNITLFYSKLNIMGVSIIIILAIVISLESLFAYNDIVYSLRNKAQIVSVLWTSANRMSSLHTHRDYHPTCLCMLKTAKKCLTETKIITETKMITNFSNNVSCKIGLQ